MGLLGGPCGITFARRWAQRTRSVSDICVSGGVTRPCAHVRPSELWAPQPVFPHPAACRCLWDLKRQQQGTGTAGSVPSASSRPSRHLPGWGRRPPQAFSGSCAGGSSGDCSAHPPRDLSVAPRPASQTGRASPVARGRLRPACFSAQTREQTPRGLGQAFYEGFGPCQGRTMCGKDKTSCYFNPQPPCLCQVLALVRGIRP